VTRCDSGGVSVVPFLRLTKEAQVTMMYIEAEGVVGMHPAVVPQLFCVMANGVGTG
jgi:hypothetical protein